MKQPASIQALLLLALTWHPCAQGFDLEELRENFLDAEVALERGDLVQFELLSGFLEDYPLFPYLRYAQLVRNLGQADTAAIEHFLADFADTPLAGRLRRAWLERLAKQRRWMTYARFYVPGGSISEHCHYLQGLLLSDQQEKAFDQVDKLWLTGKSLPAACDPPLSAWKQAGRLSNELVWQRIALAMGSGDTRLAGYLGRSLPRGERVWVERWRSIHDDPRQVANSDHFTERHPYRTRILAHGIARLARMDPSLAAETWDRLSDELDFAPAEAQRANAAVGVALTERGDRRGLDYLEQIRARKDNLDLQEQRLRAALKQKDWRRVADWVAAMPDTQVKSEHWLYWQARAEEILGNAETAHDLFAVAAGERSLWGFLAAERARRPYKLGEDRAPVDPQRVSCIEQSAGIARIRELQALGRQSDVSREWYWMTRDMNRESLMAAAIIAQRLGWPDRAIFALARSGYWDDLGLRFPLLYQHIVRYQASVTGQDASWIYAVLRQESAFNPQARSSAGAMGLMQLMPATAREVAQSLGVPYPTRTQLFDPQVNILLGSSYLMQMLRRFDGNPVLAAAAYNAGPARVESWLPEQAIDADLWIATIPFRETRTYVRRVLAYRLIYDHRLGLPLEPLHADLQPISQSETKPATAGGKAVKAIEIRKSSDPLGSASARIRDSSGYSRGNAR